MRLNYSVTVRYEGCRYSWYCYFPKVRARVRVGCLGRCMGLTGFGLELGSGSNVRVNTIIVSV